MTQLPAIIPCTEIIGADYARTVPALIVAAGDRASLRFLEFFAADIRNPHTRRAYNRAVTDFLAWCDDNLVPTITAVRPLHVAMWIELQTRERAAPTVKLQLAALRHLFDWLVMGQVIPVNPASSVRGPAHSPKIGRTAVLAPEEARTLLDSIDTTTPAGLRDRALIALMVYSFARIGAALAMKVEDVFTQNRRLWVRLREKGGKPHAMPCHHNLETYLNGLHRGCRYRAKIQRVRCSARSGAAPGYSHARPCRRPTPIAMIGRRASGRRHRDEDRQP